MAPRQPPSPVAEEADEGFSPCNATMDNGSDVRINIAGIFVLDSSTSLFTTHGTSSSVLLRISHHPFVLCSMWFYVSFDMGIPKYNKVI